MNLKKRKEIDMRLIIKDVVVLIVIVVNVNGVGAHLIALKNVGIVL